MSGITKCSGEGCPHAETCRRVTAPSGWWQSWFPAPPVRDDGDCDHYMPAGGKP